MKKFAPLVLCGIFLAGCTQQRGDSMTEPTNTPQAEMHAHGAAITSEKDFIVQMIPHHQEAIDTSRVVNAQTTDPELQAFTEEVIKVQMQEVDQLKAWLTQWYQEDFSANNSYQPMMGDLTTAQGKELEKRYVQGMIVHHQGAIEMAQQVLVLNPRPEIQNMAQEILSVQQAEVETLQDWLNTKYTVVREQDSADHSRH